MILLDGNKVSSLEIDLSVTSAGTGGIGARLPAQLGLRQQQWRSNPSGRHWLNHPLERVKVESNYTPVSSRRTVSPLSARNHGAENKSRVPFVWVTAGRSSHRQVPRYEATKGDQSIPVQFRQFS